MRSNLKWLYVLSCLMVLVGVASATTKTVSPGVLNDPGEPGSVLVFPLYERGTISGPDQTTVPISEFEISVVCPNGSVCPEFEDVDIKLHWVCFDQDSPQCQETDFTLNTTVNGTIRFDPQGNCTPVVPFGQNIDTCGFIPPPPCDDGYLIAWVVDDITGGAIKFDGLLGDSVLRETYTAVTAYNAIPIQAGTKLATGASTDLYKNGHLNFNGQAYKELTNTVIGSVHYDGTDQYSIYNDTALVLLTLDTKSNQLNNLVEVNFLFYNEIEQPVSENASFFCADQVYLYDFGLTNPGFGAKGLVEASAQKLAVLGVTDHTGPVTLLGLVITREDSDTRNYIYPLLDNSIPLATAFAP